MELIGLLIFFLILGGILQGILWLVAMAVAYWPFVVGGLAVLGGVGVTARILRRVRTSPPGEDRIPATARLTLPSPRPITRPEPRVPAESGDQISLQPMEFTPLDQAACPVCRTSLSSDVVFCCRCRTPHHRECFRYAGRCAVYACRGRRRRRALAPAS